MSVRRIPDPCPNHTECMLVKTVVRDIGNPYNKRFKDRLTQYLCAEPGCRQGMGWIYEAPEWQIKSGPGHCEDGEILNHILSQELEPHTLVNVFCIFIIAVVPMGTAVIWGTENNWNIFTAGAVCLISSAIAAALGFAAKHHRQAKHAISQLKSSEAASTGGTA